MPFIPTIIRSGLTITISITKLFILVIGKSFAVCRQLTISSEIRLNYEVRIWILCKKLKSQMQVLETVKKFGLSLISTNIFFRTTVTKFADAIVMGRNLRRYGREGSLEGEHLFPGFLRKKKVPFAWYSTTSWKFQLQNVEEIDGITSLKNLSSKILQYSASYA